MEIKDENGIDQGMIFSELMAAIGNPDVPYKFPCGEYDIIGDTAEIDKIINTCGYINIDVGDIEKALSRETTNYVSTGSADGTDCIANALADALHKLPIEIDAISKILFNIWRPKEMPSPMKEMKSMTDFISMLPTDIDLCWGIASDESMEGQSARISLIAVSK